MDDILRKIEKGDYKKCLIIESNQPQQGYLPVKKGETLDHLNEQITKAKNATLKSIFAKAVSMTKENTINANKLSSLEEYIFQFLLFDFLSPSHFSLFGIDHPDDEHKKQIIKAITEEQKNILKRNFMTSLLSRPDVRPDSYEACLLSEYCQIHFTRDFEAFKKEQMEVYQNKVNKIERKIEIRKKNESQLHES